MGDLTQEQVEEYLSKSPINESNEPIQPIEVDWAIEEEMVNAKEVINNMLNDME